MIVKIITTTQDFISNLDKPASSKVYQDIELLKDFGKNLGFPHSRKIGENLYELRIFGKIQIRLFYGFEKNTCWVVHGFVKKTNKIPIKEIKIAESRIKQLAL